MVVLGLLFGLFLGMASRVFSKKGDPRIEEVLAALPNINCGACGYGSCRAYAEAVVGGEEVNLCRPGGEDTARTVAGVMGVEAVRAARKRAVVHCQGGLGRCAQRATYYGEQDCRAAHLTAGGQKKCIYGCLGFGTCAEACPFDAITMNEERLPVIDPGKCTACGICVEVCPRDLIDLLEVEYTTYLGCSFHGKGRAVKEICSVGCTACQACVKKDPAGAISMKDDLPVLDFAKAGGDFSVAAEVCPMNCFVVEVRAREPAGAVQA